MADPDWTDPCAVLAWLRPQYYRVAGGLQEVKIVYGGRETQYGIASLEKLDGVIARLESQCAALEGRTKRRAIVAG